MVNGRRCIGAGDKVGAACARRAQAAMMRGSLGLRQSGRRQCTNGPPDPPLTLPGSDLRHAVVRVRVVQGRVAAAARRSGPTAASCTWTRLTC